MANANQTAGHAPVPVQPGRADLHAVSGQPNVWRVVHPPKVAVVGLRGIPDISGGIETHCEYLFPKIADLNRSDDFIVIGRRPSMGGQMLRRQGNLTVVPLGAFRNKYLETISNTILGVIAARVRFRSQIVHLHAVGPALLSPLARLLGAKVVFTHHGDDYRRAKWNKAVQWILKTGERIGIASSHRVIAVSASLADRLRREYPRKAEAIHYIPNGADHILDEIAQPKRSTADWLEAFGLTGQSYFVSVGRLVPEKGFADLIRAYAIAKPQEKLVIVGGQSGSSHDQEIADLIRDNGLQARVILTGAIPREGVASLLAAADLFVLASHHEGLPIAALEASAMGAPILVSDIQPNVDLGLPEQHYFPVGDAKALAARLVSGGQDLPPVNLLAEFNWARIAEQTNAVYEGLVPKRA